MPLALTVTRGYTMTPGAKPSVDDWNAAFLPSVTIDPGSGLSGDDIADGAITFDKLHPEVILSGTTITALEPTDLLLVGDDSAQDNAVITVANALRGIFGLSDLETSFTAFAADTLTLHDGTDTRRMTVARFVEQILEQAPVLSGTPASADKLLILDADATDGNQAKVVNFDDVLPDTGTAGTYAVPTSITTDDKGRVTAVTTSGVGARMAAAKETPIALPSGAGNANKVGVEHELGGKPGIVSVHLVCIDAGGDADYSQNDEIDYTAVLFDENTLTDQTPLYIIEVTNTHIYLIQPDMTGGVRIASKTTGNLVTFTRTKWNARIVAIR